MSKAQYDFSQKTNYLKRTMFLDPAGPVTVQRFEEVKYPKLQNYESLARGFFWVPEEISLTKDKMDHKEASDAVKHIFTSNLLRQTALDSIQGRAPFQVFGPVTSIPELEALTLTWSFFETSIHSKSYSTLSVISMEYLRMNLIKFMTLQKLLVWLLESDVITKNYMFLTCAEN